MKPKRFERFVAAHGQLETYAAGQVFHSQDFPKKIFYLKSGYVKRYQSTKPNSKVLELIYGPGHIISLSQLYKLLFNVDQNEENFIYVYQTMTQVEMLSLSADEVVAELERDAELYKDFFYEAGLKLRSNIFRLASNSIKDDYKKVAHQLMSLAYEFAGVYEGDSRSSVKLPLPQTAVDIAEQLNISAEVAESVLARLSQLKIISTRGATITILDLNRLKDSYL